MGILAPLYLAGLAALALPLIFHLVRRTPRGRQDFSSLMFLSPSPPRLTRRSRLEQIFLLLLRLAALALVAFAFSRPFLREAASLSFSDLPQRRVAILLDTSASMRRDNLWQQALRQVEHELDQLTPHDEVALYTFGDRLQTVVGFDSGTHDAKSSRAEFIRQSLQGLAPGWGGTDLGSALVAVAGELDAASDVKQLPAEPQIVLIGDFQKGAAIEALQAYEWPKKVHVVPRQLSASGKTNATVQLLVGGEEEPGGAEPRVRVVNSADSAGDQFFVRWDVQQPPRKGNKQSGPAGEVAVYVPPGQTRVVKLPRLAGALAADRIVLRGDDQDFDNTYFVVPPKQREVTILYAGADAADDPQGLLYYLKLATGGDPLWKVAIEPLTDAKALADEPRPQLVVVSGEVSAELQAELKVYVERGGTLLAVPIDEKAARLLPALVPEIGVPEIEVGEPAAQGEGDFLLLGEIDFTHPLFAPFAQPRYSDFTKIHFWRHQPLKVAGTLRVPSDGKEVPPQANGVQSGPLVVARFDNGDPAVIEASLGEGRVMVLASTWRPDDSQLALSSKFVPLVAAMMEQASGTGAVLASAIVGQPVGLPDRKSGLVVVTPSGKEQKIDADAKRFDAASEPGVYRVRSLADESQFAVNLPTAESNTAPLDLEQIEQFGVQLAGSKTKAERLDRVRQQRDTELESRQKIWRWLLVAALGVLVFETVWAGYSARQIERAREVAA
jgi:hypothetical protein